MTIQVIIRVEVDINGDDYLTREPATQRIAFNPSPAQLWQYELQAADNYLAVSDQIPPQALWIDPQVVTGATFTLKGSTLDVGVAISSTNPSLIPVAQQTPIGATVSAAGATLYAPQNDIILTSSLPVQTAVGWF